MKLLFTFSALFIASGLTAPKHGPMGGAKDLSEWPSPTIRVGPRHTHPDTWIAAKHRRQAPHTPGQFRGPAKRQDEMCGLENSMAESDKIVGGMEANPHQFPWLVALFCGGQWFCSASILSENWVMTAAHCVDGANFFEVYAGSHDLSLSVEDGRQVVTSYNGFHHPGWDYDTLVNDIALVQLPEPLVFNDKVRPACLPCQSDVSNDFANDVVTATGWGKLSDESSSKADQLHYAPNIPVMSNTECQWTYGNLITSSNICIDTTGGHGVCNGDSGGPLNLAKTPGKFTEVGVASFVSSQGCASGLPHGFTRVTSYLDWISSETGIEIGEEC